MLGSMLSRIKFFVFRYRNRSKAKIGKYCHIVNTIFEGKNSVADGTRLTNCKLGYGSYISKNTNLSYVKMGRFCSIADSVCVCIGNHPINYVTTHPAFYYNTEDQIGWTYYRGEPFYKEIYKYPKDESFYQIVIGSDVWIGSHALIMGGIKIGDGAIIAAGAVVTKDVEPYSIVGGVPAKQIKMRFSKEIIEKLVEIKLWDKPIIEIERDYMLYTDVNKFLSKE